jgi:hypothetical protein
MRGTGERLARRRGWRIGATRRIVGRVSRRRVRGAARRSFLF